EERLFAQLLQRRRAVMALLDVGEAAFAQHTVHDTGHRVQVVNNQYRIDVVDQGQPSPFRPCLLLASNSPTAPKKRARRPDGLIYTIRTGINPNVPAAAKH